jgi:hypothetical protein
MELSFHHFFVFCSRGGAEADRLVSAGFAEGSRNTHPGQGTANRRFFFSNGMLEFLWVENSDEIRSSLTSPTYLYERSQYPNTGFSPYGIGTFGPNTDEVRPFPGWPYKPSYLPPELEIWVADNGKAPEEPMLFYGSFFPDPSKSSGGEPTIHPNSVGLISRIAVQMAGKNRPWSAALDLFNKIDLLNFQEGGQPLATIEFGQKGQKRELDLRPSVPLVLMY